MSGVLLYLAALGLMALEGVVLDLFSVQGWALQTPLVVAIYVGLDREFVSGACILGLLCFPVEWLVGGVFGTYSLALVAVFLSLQLVRANLQPTWGLARGIAAGAAALIHSGVLLVALMLVGQGDTQLTATVGWQMWTGAVVVAAAAVAFGKGFATLEQKMNPKESRLELDPSDS